MGIKWENIKILMSPLTNNIYLGKLDKTGMFARDKSEDRSKEITDTVAAHLNRSLPKGKNKVVIEYNDGTLTWKRSEVPNEQTSNKEKE